MSIGLPELLLLVVVVVLLFGTGKLTRAMGDLAQGYRTFRDEMKDVEPEPASPQRSLAGPSSADAAAMARPDRPARP